MSVRLEEIRGLMLASRRYEIPELQWSRLLAFPMSVLSASQGEPISGKRIVSYNVCTNPRHIAWQIHQLDPVFTVAHEVVVPRSWLLPDDHACVIELPGIRSGFIETTVIQLSVLTPGRIVEWRHLPRGTRIALAEAHDDMREPMGACRCDHGMIRVLNLT